MYPLYNFSQFKNHKILRRILQKKIKDKKMKKKKTCLNRNQHETMRACAKFS